MTTRRMEGPKARERKEEIDDDDDYDDDDDDDDTRVLWCSKPWKQ